MIPLKAMNAEMLQWGDMKKVPVQMHEEKLLHLCSPITFTYPFFLYLFKLQFKKHNKQIPVMPLIS